MIRPRKKSLRRFLVNVGENNISKSITDNERIKTILLIQFQAWKEHCSTYSSESNENMLLFCSMNNDDLLIKIGWQIISCESSPSISHCSYRNDRDSHQLTRTYRLFLLLIKYKRNERSWAVWSSVSFSFINYFSLIKSEQIVSEATKTAVNQAFEFVESSVKDFSLNLHPLFSL